MSTLLESDEPGEVKVIYVAHKDRLCRFGFELVEQIVLWSGGSIVVANAETLSPHEELTQDLLSGLKHFWGRNKPQTHTG